MGPRGLNDLKKQGFGAVRPHLGGTLDVEGLDCGSVGSRTSSLCHDRLADLMSPNQDPNRCLHELGSFLWVSLQQEHYYLGSVLGSLISGNSRMRMHSGPLCMRPNSQSFRVLQPCMDCARAFGGDTGQVLYTPYLLMYGRWGVRGPIRVLSGGRERKCIAS